jgi:hypothetical protein
LTITSNKYAVITGAFSSAYVASSSKAISLGINGVTNPGFAGVATSSFEIDIYYTAGTDEIDTLSTGLTVTPVASTSVSFSVALGTYDTGVDNN